MRPVQLACDTRARFFNGLPARRTGVEVVQLDSQCGAALQVVDKVAVGLVSFGFVDLGEVDEVGAVREDV